MEQQARNATMEEWGILRGCRYLLHDRDTKFCASFRELIGPNGRGRLKEGESSAIAGKIV
jgi:hypothetical protein